VELDVLFSLVLRVLLPLKQAVKVDRLAVSVRDEVGHVGARLEGPLITVDKERPWVLRVDWVAPTAVLPLAVEVVVLEGGILRVGNVRLPLLLHVDAPRR